MFKPMITKPKAPAISIRGFLMEIFLLHFLHLPERSRKERIGMLSYHSICWLHSSHLDLPFVMESPLGYRLVNAPKKDPTQRPLTNKNTVNIITVRKSENQVPAHLPHPLLYKLYQLYHQHSNILRTH